MSTIGIENDLQSLLNDLLALGHDAVDSYRAGVGRAETESVRTTLADFQREYQSFTQALVRALEQLGMTTPSRGEVGAFLTDEKRTIGNTAGDHGVIRGLNAVEARVVGRLEEARANRLLVGLQPVDGLVERATVAARRHLMWLTARL